MLECYKKMINYNKIKEKITTFICCKICIANEYR